MNKMAIVRVTSIKSEIFWGLLNTDLVATLFQMTLKHVSTNPMICFSSYVVGHEKNPPI